MVSYAAPPASNEAGGTFFDWNEESEEEEMLTKKLVWRRFRCFYARNEGVGKAEM